MFCCFFLRCKYYTIVLGKPNAVQKQICTVVQGSPLNEATLKAVAEAMKTEKMNSHSCIAYEKIVKIGGELAWRANNPANIASSKKKKIHSQARAIKAAVIFLLSVLR